MKTILITGATDGLGKATAFALAKLGHELILHGRNQIKGAKLISDIKAQTGNQNLHYYNADFAELAQIKSLSQTVLSNHSNLNVLVNNAGLGVESSRRESKDGIEMIFQVDYLSTYILSNLLLPLLEKSENPQVINVASAGQAPINFSDPLLEKTWSGVQSYCQAKLCQIALTFEMALSNKKVSFNALHPASYMPTKIVTHMFSPQSEIQDGVESLLHLIATEIPTTGKYYFQRKESVASEQAYDPNARKKLMALSLELTGI